MPPVPTSSVVTAPSVSRNGRPCLEGGAPASHGHRRSTGSREPPAGQQWRRWGWGAGADAAARADTRGLAALFKMSPEFWMNLQASWDLHQARLAMKKAG